METEPVKAPRRPAPWGDRPGSRYVLEIKRARAAEAPWRLAAEPGAPDTILDAGWVGDLVVRVASTRGPSHRFYGAVREDAAAVLNVHDRFIGAAVADGVGSVPGSADAARIAVESSLHHFQLSLLRRPEPAPEDLDRLLRDAIKQANEALVDRWGGPPATTLTVAVASARPDPDGRYLYAVASVGDSPSFVLVEGEFGQPLGASPAGELHSTQTAALPVEAPENRFLVGHLPASAVLLLASDGLGAPLSSADVQQELASRWRRPPDLIDFLTQVQFRRKSYDDDRSVVAIWTPEVGTPPTPARRLPVTGPSPNARPRLPGPAVQLDAGQAGGIEVRAAAIHHQHSGSVGAVTAGDDRVVAAIAQGPFTGGASYEGCRWALRELLRLARARLLRQPAEPVDKLLARTVVDAHQPDIRLQLALVDARYGYWIAPSDVGAAYQLTGGRFVPVAGARYGSLGPGEVLVLTSDGPPSPDLVHRWSAAIPGPSEFLDCLYGAGEAGDRAAMAIWAVAGARP